MWEYTPYEGDKYGDWAFQCDVFRDGQYMFTTHASSPEKAYENAARGAQSFEENNVAWKA